MTKAELDRIKKAYSSGLKVQIWFNGYWEDFDIRDYSMYPEPFSERRQYRIIGSDYADTAEKQIAELEKENAELKKEVEKHKWNDIFLEDCADYDKKIAEEYTTLQERIERLEKENAELKEKYNTCLRENTGLKIHSAYLEKKLAEAKEILRALLKHTHGQNLNTQNNFDLYLGRIKEAKQFLKELSE